MKRGEMTGPLSLKILPETQKKLRTEAKRRGVGVSELVREFIREGLRKHELDRKIIDRILREARTQYEVD